MQDFFSSNDLNLCAALAVATGQTPVVIPGELVQFRFRRDEELSEAIFAFHHGLKLNARDLLQMRNRLFARVRDARS